MKESLIERLKLMLLREDNLTLVGHPASQDEINHAVQLLNVSFHKDYVQFLRMFGGAYAGLPVHGFSNGSSLGKETVIDLTRSFREQFKDHPFAEILDISYVISMDGSGDPIFINPSGHVYIGYHDTGEIRLLAESFEDLLEENFYEW